MARRRELSTRATLCPSRANSMDLWKSPIDGPIGVPGGIGSYHDERRLICHRLDHGSHLSSGLESIKGKLQSEPRHTLVSIDVQCE